MFLRIDRLQVELPMAENPDAEAARAVQELLGGRFGEMSTLMNYMYQSFNFRGKDKLKPYYDLVANIATEEMGHIEVVAATINGLLTGVVQRGEAPDSRLAAVVGTGNPEHFLATGQGAMPANALGQAWTGDYVFNSGDVVLDMLHNFFLECGARMGKLRVYEMTTNPVARAMLGYLIVRGGVHQVAYARALETLTGVEVAKMLNIPRISNERIPEARKFQDRGVHRTLYRFSPDDYRDIDKIWRGQHFEDGSQLVVQDGPPDGGRVNPLPEEPQVFAPGYHPQELVEIAARMMRMT
ncbi:MAG TPA: manganese catalase family protein [Candidatus Dormibacteraeota bacterium]|nr:manganese catalase family protein [Candidatus Dormibacteraeota bacterium]